MLLTVPAATVLATVANSGVVLPAPPGGDRRFKLRNIPISSTCGTGTASPVSSSTSSMSYVTKRLTLSRAIDPYVLVYLGDGADGPAEAFPLAKTDEDADYDSWLLLEPEPQPEPQPEPEPMATEE